MTELRYTLLTDGARDRSLIPILDWLLREKLKETPIQSEWADFRRLRKPPHGLVDRIERATDLYPCDVLFVHRDGETEPRDVRVAEIRNAQMSAKAPPPIVCVVTIRMQEAWMLIEEQAIRLAVGNPNGKCNLALPKLKEIESIPDPKRVLRDLLLEASELQGRRRSKLQVGRCALRVAECLQDFHLLRELPSFLAFEGELDQVLERLS